MINTKYRIALAGVFAAGLSLTSMGAPANADLAIIDIVFPIPAGASLGSCDFNVEVLGSGKVKTIEKPGGRVIGVSANTKVTATGNGNTANYSINGTFHIAPADAQGNVVYKVTGRNLLTDPDAGVVVTSGNFTFTFNENGLVEGLSGTGNITDVCAALS